MQAGSIRVIAIGLLLLVTGCNSFNNLLGPQASAPLSPEQEAAEDQKCQTDGYQANTPAYEYCRGELAKQRVSVDRAQPTPPMTAHR